MILNVYFYVELQVLRRMRRLERPGKNRHANYVTEREGPAIALKTSEKSLRFIT